MYISSMQTKIQDPCRVHRRMSLLRVRRGGPAAVAAQGDEGRHRGGARLLAPVAGRGASGVGKPAEEAGVSGYGLDVLVARRLIICI